MRFGIVDRLLSYRDGPDFKRSDIIIAAPVNLKRDSARQHCDQTHIRANFNVSSQPKSMKPDCLPMRLDVHFQAERSVLEYC